MIVGKDLAPSEADILRSREVLGDFIQTPEALSHAEVSWAAGILLLREAKLSYLATHDPLTDTFNRRGFFEQVMPRIDSMAEDDAAVVYFADADGLKSINDTSGHEAGDNFLQALAGSLKSSLEDAAVVRWGGDEFAIFTDITTKSSRVALEEKADEQLECLQREADLGIQATNDSPAVGVGVSIARSHIKTGSELRGVGAAQNLAAMIKEADRAMYEIKGTKPSRQTRQRS